jgi:hypothetical protein
MVTYGDCKSVLTVSHQLSTLSWQMAVCST